MTKLSDDLIAEIDCPKCNGELVKKYTVIGHRWNFRHPTEWEMRAYYYECANCGETFDEHEVIND